MEYEDEVESVDALEAMFQVADDEFLQFDRIPESDRLHARPDLCAFLYLDRKQPGNRDMIGSASHDEIWLDYDYDKTPLTQEDVTYLHRCGVRYDSDNASLCMFA